MVLAAVFFGVEVYHWLAHVMVLTGTRMLPRSVLLDIGVGLKRDENVRLYW
jgi:hypothetical protein